MNRRLAFISYIWSKYRPLMIFAMIFIASIQFLLIYFNSTLDVAPMIEFMLSQLPPNLTEMFGEDILNQVSLKGTIGFGLEHPLVITLITFLGISITSSTIAVGSENKNLEILLSHPFKRSELISTLYIFSLFLILLLILSAFLGAILAIYIYHEPDISLLNKVILADVNSFFLHSFILSYSLFFSVYFKEVSKAIRWSAIIALIFYFLKVLSVLWDKIAFTRHINFFSYFNPQSIMSDKGNTYFDLLILGLGSIILFWVSYKLFKKKDIS